MADVRKILVVDDEPTFLLALQTTLEAKGYQVMAATNREEARNCLIAKGCNLVVLGTMTPRGEAFVLHKWIKEDLRTKHLPILVIDAPLEKRLVDGWSMDEAVQMEAEDYVTKPVEPSSLLLRIQAVLERAMKRIRVLIVDDHTIIRDGLQAVLRLQKDMEVVGEAVDGRDAVAKALQLRPDVVIMDIVMPVMNGLEATKRIVQEHPATKVVMLTQYDDEENIVTAEQLGAYGFIPKRAASSQLISGIRAVFAGQHLKRPAPASSD